MFLRQPLTCFQIKMPIVQGMSPMQRTPLWTTHKYTDEPPPSVDDVLSYWDGGKRHSIAYGSDSGYGGDDLNEASTSSRRRSNRRSITAERSILEIEIVVATHHTSVGIIRLTLCPPRSASAMTMMPTRILHIYHKQVHQKFTSLRLSMQML